MDWEYQRIGTAITQLHTQCIHLLCATAHSHTNIIRK